MIVVVDDDVGFAEELQDLLMLHGYPAVVVVTHPHASSLTLLGSAKLLILDLSLAVTTALGVLKELGSRGRWPSVVIVSGSGSEALEEARMAAVASGFHILGALPKPVVPERLLELIGALDAGALPAATGAADRMVEPDGSRALQIVRAGSLEHQGMFLSLDAETDPGGIVPQALGAQRSLSIQGRYGFVVVCLVEEMLSTPSAVRSICSDADHARHLREKIVFDLGPQSAEHAASAADLRAAGFGLLVRVEDARHLAKVAAELPVTMVAMQADLLVASIDSGDEPAILNAVRTLHSRSIRTLCTEVKTVADLGLARTLGFDLVTTIIANS